MARNKLTKSMSTAAVLASACLLAACGTDDPPAANNPPAADPQSATPPTGKEADEPPVEQGGRLAEPTTAQGAFTYDPAAAPVGAEVKIESRPSGNGTVVNLEVDNLVPNRGYAAHLHVNPCGPTGDAAGPHFQNQVDPAATPEKPSSDPAYANPRNEFWLDLATNAEGDGESRTEVPFGFTDRFPGSLVIHAEHHTATEPGKAGTAGGRLACLTVPFK